MGLFKSYKILQNNDNLFEVYHRDNVFYKWKLMKKFVGEQNGLVFVPAIFPTKEAANIFIEETKKDYDRS